MNDDRCRWHPHSTPEGARRCRAKQLQQQADRKLRHAVNTHLARPGYLWHRPPRRHPGPVEIWIFGEAKA